MLFLTRNLIVSRIPQLIMLLVYEMKIVHFLLLLDSKECKSSGSFSLIGRSLNRHANIRFISLIANPTFVAWKPVEIMDATNESNVTPSGLEKLSPLMTFSPSALNCDGRKTAEVADITAEVADTPVDVADTAPEESEEEDDDKDDMGSVVLYYCKGKKIINY